MQHETPLLAFPPFPSSLWAFIQYKIIADWMKDPKVTGGEMPFHPNRPYDLIFYSSMLHDITNQNQAEALPFTLSMKHKRTLIHSTQVVILYLSFLLRAQHKDSFWNYCSYNKPHNTTESIDSKRL